MLKMRFLFLSLLLCFANISFAQIYYAVHVQGQIQFQNLKKNLGTGDKIDATNLLNFKPNSWAILVGEKGNLFLQAPSNKDSIATCSKAIQPIAGEKKQANAIDYSQVDNLQAYFEGSQFVFIGNDFQLTLNPEFYVLSPQLFLIYRYEYNERHITIEIPYTKQTIFLNPATLYTYKGEKIPPHKTTNNSLYIFNAVDNIPYSAATLNPIWLSDEKVKNEFQALKKAYTLYGKNFDQMKQGYIQYIREVYGKTDEHFLSKWIDNQLQ